MKILKKEMKLKGYTSRVLAKKMGVSKTTVYKWQQGEFLPSPDNIMDLKNLGFSDTACLEPSKNVEA